MKEFSVNSDKKEELITITYEVENIVKESKVKDGVCHVFVPHTTAGITINENADPSVVRDIIYGLKKIVPETGYQHAEGNSPAHIKASLVGSSVSVFIKGSRLSLGTWQGIYLCEFDGPRTRQVTVKISQ